MNVNIGDTVSYNRDGTYSFTNGVVLTTDDVRRGAVVQWQAENGAHQAFCGFEFLTVTNGTALEVKTPAFAGAS